MGSPIFNGEKGNGEKIQIHIFTQTSRMVNDAWTANYSYQSQFKR